MIVKLQSLDLTDTQHSLLVTIVVYGKSVVFRLIDRLNQWDIQVCSRLQRHSTVRNALVRAFSLEAVDEPTVVYADLFERIGLARLHSVENVHELEIKSVRFEHNFHPDGFLQFDQVQGVVQ